MKKQMKKLKLAKETLRSLSEGDAKEVVGGITNPTCQWACFATEHQSTCVC
ncbi:MAG TPA: class I lanthipeptide [Thermoanaerobaculia bacterium]|nr:class I lanthipeptide [Thermoanaerobaculia bacterium]